MSGSNLYCPTTVYELFRFVLILSTTVFREKCFVKPPFVMLNFLYDRVSAYIVFGHILMCLFLKMLTGRVCLIIDIEQYI